MIHWLNGKASRSLHIDAFKSRIVMTWHDLTYIKFLWITQWNYKLEIRSILFVVTTIWKPILQWMPIKRSHIKYPFSNLKCHFLCHNRSTCFLKNYSIISSFLHFLTSKIFSLPLSKLYSWLWSRRGRCCWCDNEGDQHPRLICHVNGWWLVNNSLPFKTKQWQKAS